MDDVRGILIALMVPAVGLAAVPAAAKEPPPLRVATYNVCKTSCATGQFSWDKRSGAVIGTILSAGPDVLALQEADNSHLWIEEQLRHRGYAKVQATVDDCTPLGSACIDDSWLFYKTSRVQEMVTAVPSEPVSEQCRPYVSDGGELPAAPVEPVIPPPPSRADYATRDQYAKALAEWQAIYDPIREAYNVAWRQYDATMQAYERADAQFGCSRFVGRTPFTDAGSGFISLTTIGKASLAQSVDDRNFTWAVLRDRRTGGAFIPVSIHMPNEKSGRAEQYRVGLAKNLVSYLKRTSSQLGAGKSPVILMGDFNSYWQRQPRGVQWVFERRGFTDAYTARKRVNDDVPTVNLTKTHPNPFPARPFRFDQPARLDYVMLSKGRALRYEVHLRLKGNGAFDNRFRGSDHNLVLADVALPKVRLGDSWTAR